MDEDRLFVDHFHTCFVLKALAKIEAMTKDPECTKAIERGVDYYVNNLFDEEGFPKPFSRRPRMTVYRRELYDYAECINVGVLLAGRFPGLDETLSRLLPKPSAVTRLGQYSDAPLGSITNVSKSLLSALSKRSELPT